MAECSRAADRRNSRGGRSPTAPPFAHRARLALALLAGALVAGVATPVAAYHHHAAKVRFREHTPESFEEARSLGRPVFVLISAAWCYWCRYFEQEVLEREDVATYLNRAWVSIFVDSDRRPDLGRRYVRGWPMTVLTSPEGRVLQSFAGALRAEDFLAVLRRVEREAREAGTAPAGPAGPVPVPAPADRQTLRQLGDAVLAALESQLDPVHGGFGLGRKPPHGWLLAHLLEQEEVLRQRHLVRALEKTLDGILTGLADPVAGGFFRYAEGRRWSTPHTEKMLDVNAALALAFDRAYHMVGPGRYQAASAHAVGYLLRTLHDASDGGFFGSQSADPGYYRLPAPARRPALAPPVNRGKVAAWNGQAAVALLHLGPSPAGRSAQAAALRSAEFVRERLTGADGRVYHFFDPQTGRAELPGQPDAQAWTALALLEAYRAARRAEDREVGLRVLDYTLRSARDARTGLLVERPDGGGVDGRRAIAVQANGILALALGLAYETAGRPEHLDAARRILSALGGTALEELRSESDDGGARLAEWTFYLKAYRWLLGRA
jgi:uncharacterized protein YyaL (SSP411 family)